MAELKRLNKIEKEIEIHARSTLRIPVTPFTVLLDTLPGVHSSGNSSPKHAAVAAAPSAQLLDNNPVLEERLLIASVSNASPTSINDIILDSKITPVAVPVYHDHRPPVVESLSRELDSRVPLLSGEMDESVPQPRIIPVRHRFDFNGTDCDMSWACLFVCILLLCVAIPLIYVFWTVEHDHNHQHGEPVLPSLFKNTTSHNVVVQSSDAGGGGVGLGHGDLT